MALLTCARSLVFRLSPGAFDEKVSALQVDGRLGFTAGKIVGATRIGDSARVDWRVRGTDRVQSITVQRVINCTGPSGDLASSTDLLLRDLLTAGHVRQDSLGLGLDVERQGASSTLLAGRRTTSSPSAR